MKKVYTVFSLVAAAGLSMAAQQLPNAGFEGEWEQSRPWNSVCGTDLSMDDALEAMGTKPEGGVNQPEGWIISNVLGVVSERDPEYGGGYGGVGSTIVGTRVAGKDSESAVKLTNSPNPFMATQIVPAYLTLGTSWATNTLNWSTFSPENKDGGVFGGMEFTGRPDAVAFDYKLEAPADGALQKATALVYAWKGTWTQADVPANNTMSGEPVKVTMTDRDRNILGMDTDQGGAVSHSDDAELIAKGLKYIETAAADWTAYELPIEYLSTSVPAKINIVLSANDYFNSTDITSGNSLTVDNVKFVYYSRLKSLSVAGSPVEGFDSDILEYTINGPLPEMEELGFELMSERADIEASVDEAAKVITLTVTNQDGEDADGLTAHNYRLTFVEAPRFGGTVYEGNVVIDLGAPSEPIPAKVHIITDENNPAKCTLVLPDFSLGAGATIGDIIVPDVDKTVKTDRSGYTYKGFVRNLTLKMGEDEIHANVNVNGTTDNDGNAVFDIPVTWLTEYDSNPDSDAGFPIGVTFNGKTDTPDSAGISDVTVDDDNAPVEYFNLQGMRLSQPEAGQIVIRRQGSKVSKILVK